MMSGMDVSQLFRWNFLTNSVRLSTGPYSELSSSIRVKSSRLCELWLPGPAMGG